MLPDVNQAVEEIRGESNSAQVKTMQQVMIDSTTSSPPQELNLVAHSRGGLALQQALANTKTYLGNTMSEEDVNEALSHISISAYGTAEQRWPTGPVYTKINNTSDPIPGVISGAQQALPVNNQTDYDTTATRYIHEPQLNPIDAHSLDKVYTPQMVQAAGARDCDCS